VRLCPDEAGIHQFDVFVVDSPDLFETIAHHLSGLKKEVLPPRRLPIPVTVFAMFYLDLLLDVFSDVNPVLEAINARVGLVGRHHHCTLAASYLLCINESHVSNLCIIDNPVAHT
jgi:hypothetical protein